MYVTFQAGKSIINWTPSTGFADLYKSEAPHDGFELVANVDLSKGQYIDTYEETIDTFMYYKLDGELAEFNEMPNRYAQEILRRDKWFLKSDRFSGGTEAILWIKRNEGNHCPDCWDDINEKRTRSNCPTCNNTGFIDPYYAPIKIYVDAGPDNGTVMPGLESYSKTNYNNYMWTTNIPMVKPNDVIHFNGVRYRVSNGIKYSRAGKYITKQRVPLEPIEDHTPEYKMPIENVVDCPY